MMHCLWQLGRRVSRRREDLINFVQALARLLSIFFFFFVVADSLGNGEVSRASKFFSILPWCARKETNNYWTSPATCPPLAGWEGRPCKRQGVQRILTNFFKQNKAEMIRRVDSENELCFFFCLSNSQFCPLGFFKRKWTVQNWDEFKNAGWARQRTRARGSWTGFVQRNQSALTRYIDFPSTNDTTLSLLLLFLEEKNARTLSLISW